MNGRLGITADETLSKIDKLNLRERRTREFRKDRELFRSVFSDHYKIEEIAQNRQANLRQKKISFGDPNNTVLSAAVLPRASSFGSYTERSNGSGPVKDIPSLNMLRIALKTDPLTRFGNPMLGNYFKGENIVLPVIHESLREMDKKYSTISAEKILQVSLNPGDTAAEIIRNGLKKAKETVDYHSMDALQTYTEEDYLRLGIEIYTELAVNLQSALVPGTSQSIREKIQSDLDRLALEKSEMQRAYYALYCM